LSLLNHFTVPVAISPPPRLRHERAAEGAKPKTGTRSNSRGRSDRTSKAERTVGPPRPRRRPPRRQRQADRGASACIVRPDDRQRAQPRPQSSLAISIVHDTRWPARETRTARDRRSGHAGDVRVRRTAWTVNISYAESTEEAPLQRPTPAARSCESWRALGSVLSRKW
jgi:hypothetical protein